MPDLPSISPAPSSAERGWRRLAARTARRVNIGWWSEMAAAPAMIGGLIGGCAAMWLRRDYPETAPWLWPGAIALLAGAIATGWWRARHRFEKKAEALVRLEASMRLRSALSAAAAGVCPWPDPPGRAAAGLRWNWPRLLLPPLAAATFLTAGLWIPISPSSPVDGPPPEPISWRQIDATLTRLDETDAVDETSLEETRKRLEELRSRDPQEWFSHASLEATDQLKQNHEAESARLERDLTRAERALDALQNRAGALGEKERAQLLNEFDRALQDLQQGGLKPNPELLKQLGQLDPEALQQLDPAQLHQLRENMRNAAGALRASRGAGDPGNEWFDELEGGEGANGDEAGKNGEGPGAGGVNRGPGTAPNLLGRDRTDVDGGRAESLQSEDLSHALPGDLLQLQDGEHEVDESVRGPRAGGHSEHSGRGGDQVWKTPLDPDEQNAVRRFFR